MIKYIFIYIFSIITFSAFAQNTELDSLNSINEPSIKVTYLIELSNKYIESDSTLAFKYLRSAVNISKKNNLNKQLGASYKQLGSAYHYYNMGNDIKLYLHLAEKTLIKTNDIESLTKVYNNLGVYYIKWGHNYPLALQYLNKSLKLKKHFKAGDALMASAYYNLGDVNLHLNEYIKALAYYFNALESEKKTTNSKRVSMAYNTIAEAYYLMGITIKAEKYLKLSQQINNAEGYEVQQSDNYLLVSKIFLEHENVDSTLYYIYKAKKVYSRKNNLLGIGRVYTRLIDVDLFKENFDSIFDYGKKAEAIFIKTGSIKKLSWLYSKIGYAYSKVNKVNIAKQYISKSEEINEQHNFFKIELYNLLSIAEINYNQKKYSNAFEYYSKFIKLNDSISNLKTIQVASSLDDHLAIKKKQNELIVLEKINEETEKKLNRNRTIRNYLYIILLLGLVILGLVYNLYRNKQKHTKLLEGQVKERTNELGLTSKKLANSKKNETDINRIKSEVLRNLSQSLKSPIESINQLVVILKEENEDNIEIYEQLELIDVSTSRLNSVVNSITQLYKLEEKKLSHNKNDKNFLITLNILVQHYLKYDNTHKIRIKNNNKLIHQKLEDNKVLIVQSIDYLLAAIYEHSSQGNIDIEFGKENVDVIKIKLSLSNLYMNSEIYGEDLTIKPNNNNSSNCKFVDNMFVNMFIVKKILHRVGAVISWKENQQNDTITFHISFRQNDI